MKNTKLIIALDFADADTARNFIKLLNPADCKLKIGKELFTRAGPEFVREVVALGYDVFLDLKFHDIPATVAKACIAAADLGIWMLNVHAIGGQAMMQAAREALAARSERPRLIAVTVLTSMTEHDFRQIGINDSLENTVLRLATMAKESGLDGVVCSAQEAPMLRQHLPKSFCLVTPGIRPLGSASNDQSRIVTPSQAILNGVDYIVVGRPITQAADPMAVVASISNEIRTPG